MKWSVLGKLLLPALVHLQQFVENKETEGKKAAVFELLKDTLSDLDDVHLLDNPKVLVAIEKANDALVDVQNVIAAVKKEAEDQ